MLYRVSLPRSCVSDERLQVIRLDYQQPVSVDHYDRTSPFLTQVLGCLSPPLRSLRHHTRQHLSLPLPLALEHHGTIGKLQRRQRRGQ